MVSITVSVSPEVKSLMQEFPEVNWSGFVKKAIEEKTSELKWREETLEKLKKEQSLEDWSVKLQREGRQNRGAFLRKKKLIWMKLCVDSNVLFTFFWPNSVFSTIASQPLLSLTSPIYALEEIDRHASIIREKTQLSLTQFVERKNELAKMIELVPLNDYQSALKEVLKRLPKNSGKDFLEFSNDADFLALAYQKKIPLWSNDALLKKQSVVTVFSTKEIIELLAGQ